MAKVPPKDPMERVSLISAIKSVSQLELVKVIKTKVNKAIGLVFMLASLIGVFTWFIPYGENDSLTASYTFVLGTTIEVLTILLLFVYYAYKMSDSRDTRIIVTSYTSIHLFNLLYIVLPITTNVYLNISYFAITLAVSVIIIRSFIREIYKK